MNFIHLLLGRRQFVIAFISTTLAIIFRWMPKALESIFKGGLARASGQAGTAGKGPLKGIVVYYSATGSTAKIANAIYKGMKVVIDCDVAPLKRLKPEDMAKYDVVTMGSPIWYNREVASMRVFTHDMPRMGGKYFVLFCTHGIAPYNIFWSMSRNLLKKGMTLIGWNHWYGDVTHVIRHAIPYITHGHPDEIDLREAEAFGKRMAENALKISSGQKNLIPEIPLPADNEQHLFTPPRVGGNISFGAGPPASVPKINLTRCIYPRCTQCIDNCPVSALDFSLMTTSVLADSRISVKEACEHCGALCQRVCYYDAISYVGERDTHVIDVAKCVYPECTLCVDECVMDAIDFSQDPPVVHDRCEGCDVCYCICPKDAISIPDLEEVHNNKGWWYKSPGMLEGGGPPPEGAGQPEGAGGEGAGGSGFGGMGMGMANFRQLVKSEDIGKDGKPMHSTKIPRIVLNKEDWPCHINEG